MNNPKVSLVKYTRDAEQLVTAAAKLCYASGVTKIFETTPEDTEKFLSRLREMGHLSPFEHASYSFLIEGVSRAMTHQLVRHRIASYSQRSQRYVLHDAFEYIIPPSFKGRFVETADGRVDAEKYYRDFMDKASDAYRKLLVALDGESEAAKEDARYILPNGVETKIMVTMNARELFHFFGERLCQRAQWEIRHTADEMLKQLKEVSPVIFRGIGPKCVQTGRCPEKKMSCGRFEEMKKIYSYVKK